MKLLKILGATLLLLATTACGTAVPPKIVVSDACLNFRSISFAELPKEERAKPRNLHSDNGNMADTPETVKEINAHNAKYGALCPAVP